MFENTREIQRRHMANGEGGFTLIELLIVIVVLGILAAIVVFALGGVTGQSAVAACTSDAKTVSIAVSAYEAQNPGLIPAGPTFSGSVGTDADLVPTYLKSWPSNPSYYQITLDSNGAVQVALSGTAPGAGVTGSTLASGFSTPELFEASGSTAAYTFPTGGTDAGLGICAGA